jgi:putative ATP-binding cassette transporter
VRPRPPDAESPEEPPDRRLPPPDRFVWRRWRTAVRAFATSEVGGRAKALGAALLLLLVAINGLNVVNSYVGRDFMTAIESRSMPAFIGMALLYVGVFAVSTVAAVIYRFAEERLGLLWRGWLTRRLVGDYLAGRNYYWLREDSELTNPDQRIADDIRAFTATTLSLALILLNGTFTIVAFSGVMWSISPVLFGTAVAYALLGSGLTLVFGRPLLWLNYQQSDREASLRAELVHLRENAETVAISRREGRLGARLLGRVDHLVANTKRIIAVNRNLGFFTTGYNYLIQIIPVLIVAPLFIRGEAEFGVISQSSMAFSHLLGAFSLVVTQFQQISSYAVVLARLSALIESVERVAERQASGIQFDNGGAELAWEQLTVRSPHDGSTLVEGLSLSVPPGVRTLVGGPNEAARNALFRATAGLWSAGTGRVVRPPPASILFLPERPYVPPGTLCEVLVGGERPHEVPDDDLLAALRALGAEDLVARAGGLEVERDWDDLLSIDEQQLLSLARVLLARPRFAVLDRPALVLGPEQAAHALALLAAASITAVTFASDPALGDLHDARLDLFEDGRWTWTPLRVESRGA